MFVSTRRILAAKISELRLAAGYESLEAFAKAMGVKGQAVGMWERAERVPTRAQLKRIAELCNVEHGLLADLAADAAGEKMVSDQRDLTRAVKELGNASEQLGDALAEIRRFSETYSEFHASYARIEERVNKIDSDTSRIEERVNKIDSDTSAMLQEILRRING